MNVDTLSLLELDRLIATLVFDENEPPPADHVPAHMHHIYSGNAWYCLPEYDKGDECTWQPRPFSSEDRCAITAFQHMLARGFTSELFGDSPNSHTAIFTRGEVNYWSEAETFPLAVCRAALKAVMGVGHEE